MPCCHFAKGKTFEKYKINLIKLSKKKTKVGSKGRRLIFPEFLFFWMLYPEDHPFFFFGPNRFQPLRAASVVQ